jgi:hypothetical protein
LATICGDDVRPAHPAAAAMPPMRCLHLMISLCARFNLLQYAMFSNVKDPELKQEPGDEA